MEELELFYKSVKSKQLAEIGRRKRYADDGQRSVEIEMQAEMIKISFQFVFSKDTAVR